MWCPSYCFVYVYIIYIYIPVNPHSILVKWLVFHTPSLVGVVKPKKNELLCHWGPSTHLDSWKSIERNHQADPQNQVLGITCSIFPWRFPHWISHIYIYHIYPIYNIIYIVIPLNLNIPTSKTPLIHIPHLHRSLGWSLNQDSKKPQILYHISICLWLWLTVRHGK